MSGKRETKATVILSDAKDRLEFAQRAVDEHQRIIQQAIAVRDVHKEVYDALCRSLAPKPRSNGTKPKKAATAMTEVVKKESACSQCGEAENAWTHDLAYGSAHPFVSSPSVPSAGKRSRSASAAKAAGAASTATEKAIATSAGANESGE